MFAAEQRRAQFEKKVMWAVWGSAVLAWFFVIQDWMVSNLYSEMGAF